MRKVESHDQFDEMQALIVSADGATHAFLKKQLAAFGCKVHVARCGREALERVLKLQPRLVIADLALPDLDGIAFCRALRETRIGRAMYVLLLIDSGDQEKLYEAFEAGADDCLEKPVQAHAISARLRAGERQSKLRRQSEVEAEEMRRFAAELAVTNLRLQQSAFADPATGLPNRRYALRRLTQQWSASLRSERPLSCMAIEIDHLDRIEDIAGRDATEVLLKGIARALRNESRTEDELCRLGGETFLLICPDTDLAQACRAAERLSQAVNRLPIKMAGQIRNVSVSIGVAIRLEDMASPEALIEAGKQALYVAKQTGQNRVCVAPRERDSVSKASS